MTPHERADSVKDKHGVRFQRLMQSANSTNNLPRNLEYRASRMLEITDELAAMVAPVAPCKKGCSHCCYQSVVMSDWEADRIAKFTKRKIGEFAGYVPEENGRDKLVAKFTGVRCPFLVVETGACSIYSVRPFACRLHFSMADDKEPCDIIKNPGATVPYFNFNDLEYLIGFLFVGDNCKYGDIREFFPMEVVVD